MKNKIILTVSMVVGLTFGSIVSKAQSTSPLSTNSQTTELTTSTNNLMESTVETKTSVAENSSAIVKKQKAQKPMKKDWEDRTLVGKILIITGGVIFALICVMYGTVTVG